MTHTEPRATPKDFLGSGMIEDFDWPALATAAGDVGRFVADMETGLCEIDLTLRRLTGMTDRIQAFPMTEFTDRIHPDDRPTVMVAAEAAHRSETDYETEFRFTRADGRPLWLQGRGRVIRTEAGRRLLVGVNHDVTRRRLAEERAEMLAGEMAHRIKNVFALVQSTFSMAARSSDDKATLAEAFSGRLAALAAVNELTFANPERRVVLAELVDRVLGPLVEAGQVTVDLPEELAINGTAAQTVVLALNELMTNAAKYGALSSDGGAVALSVDLVDDDFRLGWTERTTFPVAEPTGRQGFGMRVLRSMTAATFAGKPDFDWRPEGLAFSCRWPAEKMAWTNASRYPARVADQAIASTHDAV